MEDLIVAGASVGMSGATWTRVDGVNAGLFQMIVVFHTVILAMELVGASSMDFVLIKEVAADVDSSEIGCRLLVAVVIGVVSAGVAAVAATVRELVASIAHVNVSDLALYRDFECHLERVLESDILLGRLRRGIPCDFAGADVQVVNGCDLFTDCAGNAPIIIIKSHSRDQSVEENN